MYTYATCLPRQIRRDCVKVLSDSDLVPPKWAYVFSQTPRLTPPHKDKDKRTYPTFGVDVAQGLPLWLQFIGYGT